MTEYKNTSLITVLMANVKIKNADLIQNCLSQKTDDEPLLIGHVVNDTTVHSQAETLQETITKFKGKPPTATKAEVKIARNICISSYNKNVGWIQGAARDIAASGDENAAISFVQRCGFKIKKGKPPASIHFKVTSGIGEVDITTKAVAKYATYIRQYGITPEKDVPPLVLNGWVITHEVAVSVDKLKRATIYGFREASIISVPRKPKGSPDTNVEQKITPTRLTKGHKVVFTDGVENYVWSDWVYVIVR